jgi:release factor glutamine methyltransferase
VPQADPGRSRAAIVTRLRAAGCVFAEEEADLLLGAAATPAELDRLTSRRETGVPLEQVVGWASFCGQRVAVAPGVFVPRRRTEFLVREAVSLGAPGAVVVDLCCGSGAIGVALAAALHPARLHAADHDPAAVACAQGNLAPLGGHVHLGDLYGALPAGLRGQVTVLAANVPYVPSPAVATMPRQDRQHEPRAALDGGPDGLEVLRRVAAGAPDWLAPGGQLLSEISAAQAATAAGIIRAAGLTARIAHCDDLDATVVVGTQPG